MRSTPRVPPPPASGPTGDLPAEACGGSFDGREGASPYVPYSPRSYMTDVAQRVLELSIEEWGGGRDVTMVGLSSEFTRTLERVAKLAAFDEPVLITGESGAGKESLAQAIYLLGPRRGRPFVTVNCPQYLEDNLTVSELFGHVRGSFTGAFADRRGCFELADGGVIFLDEVGDLPPRTQVMLLRALATGEFFPVGSDRPRSANVRVIAATNRDLRELRGGRRFREDLFFRLSSLRVELPPLREREDDWALLAEYFLRRLGARHGVAKTFSSESMRVLGRHDWPGNVRELAGLVTTGYAMADGQLIQPQHFLSQMELRRDSGEDLAQQLWHAISEEGRDFWSTVHAAFMRRDLNRSQVRTLVRRGLRRCGGSFRDLLAEFHLPRSDYQKFMDFLRHHDLKP